MAIFYGWKISGLSMAGNFMLQGIGLACMNAFMEPLCEINGWSRLAINNSLGLASFMCQVSMPLAAAIANKVSLRFLMGLGALLGGLSACAMGLTQNFTLFTVFLIILWISSQFCGGVVGNALVSNWFYKKRGVAFALANAGSSFAGVFLPVVALYLIQTFDLRTTYLILGGITCLLGPICWHMVRKTPGKMNLHMDGLDHDPEMARQEKIDTRFKDLIHNPAVWFIGLSFGLGLMSSVGIMSQMKPRFSDVGIPAYTAMFLVSISSLIATVAKYFWGKVCDRASSIFAARLMMFCCGSCFALLLLPPTLWTLAAFGICYSFSSGGLWVVLPAVVNTYFGAANFLRVYRIVTIFIILRCCGFPIMGVSHEISGTYGLADIFFFCSFIAAFILTMLLRPEKAAEQRKSK